MAGCHRVDAHRLASSPAPCYGARMTSTPPDPGHAITLAKSTYQYLTTAGYWLVGTTQTGIDERGELASAPSALRIYQATRDLLAASDRQSGATFYALGKAWMLVVGNGEAVAQEV